jgi:hypothetical protein
MPRLYNAVILSPAVILSAAKDLSAVTQGILRFAQDDSRAQDDIRR